MRVVIACAGPQDKWGEHLGVPSHFAPVRTGVGEERVALLDRTVNMVSEYTKDIVVSAPPCDERYDYGSLARVAYVTGANEFESTRELWSTTGRTVLLLGDVYFSRIGLKRIMSRTDHGYQAFGRYGASSLTGTPYGEIFANSWWPEDIPDVESHLQRVEVGRSQGITRPAGWMLLRSFMGIPLNRHRIDQRFFTVINDWTDDIDFPEDFDRHPATRGYVA